MSYSFIKMMTSEVRRQRRPINTNTSDIRERRDLQWEGLINQLNYIQHKTIY